MFTEMLLRETDKTGKVFFKRNSFIREDAVFCFVVYFWFQTRLVCVTRHDFSSQTQFSKRIGDC